MSTSTVSPQKRGDAPDVTTLTDDYTSHAEAIEAAPLPTYRADGLAGQIRAVRDRLDADAAVPAPTLQRLLAVVSEAVGDVTAAEIDRGADRAAGDDADRDAAADRDDDIDREVSDDRDADDSRTPDGVVPGASDASDDAPYRLTPAERDALLETLVELLFTVVETPTEPAETDDATGTDTTTDDSDATTDEPPAE
ncbi:hypothetical protein [Halobaculum sp. MBLA0143]|uniref:hypothetical protein n=1 Tax=Halobaculum sp. MBLA0143 TaxID=3079933 RepID=UPI0035245708